MNVLVLCAGRRALPARTVRALSDQTRAGETVVLATWHPPTPELAEAVDEVLVLGPGGPPPTRARASFVTRVLGRLRDPGRMWRAVRRSPEASAAAARAGMVVALDTPATLSAWRLARLHRSVEAVQGFDAAAALLDDRRPTSRPTS